MTPWYPGWRRWFASLFAVEVPCEWLFQAHGNRLTVLIRRLRSEPEENHEDESTAEDTPLISVRKPNSSCFSTSKGSHGDPDPKDKEEDTGNSPWVISLDEDGYVLISQNPRANDEEEYSVHFVLEDDEYLFWDLEILLLHGDARPNADEDSQGDGANQRTVSAPRSFFSNISDQILRAIRSTGIASWFNESS